MPNHHQRGWGYDKRHFLSFNTVRSTGGTTVLSSNSLSYSASKKNISIELKKKVKGVKVAYNLNQINGGNELGEIFQAIIHYC